MNVLYDFLVLRVSKVRMRSWEKWWEWCRRKLRYIRWYIVTSCEVIIFKNLITMRVTRVMKKLGKINMMIYCDLGWSDKPLLLITNQHLHTRRHQDSHTHVDDVQDDDDGDDADDADHNVDDDDDDEEDLTFLHTRLKWRVKAGLRNPGLTSVIPQSCQLFLSSRWWGWLWWYIYYDEVSVCHKKWALSIRPSRARGAKRDAC